MAAKHRALGLIALVTLVLALAPRGALAAAAPRCDCPRNATAGGTPSDAGAGSRPHPGTAQGPLVLLASAMCMPRSILASTDVEACATFAKRGFYRGSAMLQLEPETAPDGLAWT